MKGLPFFLLLILLISPLYSMGRREQKTPAYKFAILIKKGDESWYRREADGFTERCAELGVSAIMMDNKMDPDVALMNMDLAIEKEVDAVAIIVPDQKMGPVITGRAFESSTAIVSLDHKLIDHQGRQLAPHLGIDDKSAGYEAGVWLAGRIQTLSWYGSPAASVGVALLSDSEILEYRLRVNECQRALFEWLPDLDEERCYRLQCSGTDAVGGLLAMQELLNVHPEITNWIVIAATDESGIGAVRALEQVGLSEHSIACGIQAERASEEFLKAEKTAFAGAVFYDPYQLGRQAADSLFSCVAEGAIIPAETTVPFRIVDAGDYRRITE